MSQCPLIYYNDEFADLSIEKQKIPKKQINQLYIINLT